MEGSIFVTKFGSSGLLRKLVEENCFLYCFHKQKASTVWHCSKRVSPKIVFRAKRDRRLKHELGIWLKKKGIPTMIIFVTPSFHIVNKFEGNFRNVKGQVFPQVLVVLFLLSKKHNRIKWKSRIYLSFWCVVKDMNRNLHAFFYLVKQFVLTLSVFHNFKNPKMSIGKPQI